MKTPRLLAALLALATGACGDGQQGAAANMADAATVAPAAPAAAPAAAPVVSTADIAAEGKAQALPDGRTLICGEDSRDCVCLEPATCQAEGNCPELESTVTALREALARKEGSVVNCDRAETGRCGVYSYLDFNGDQRHEVRWFDAHGKQTGLRESTDYPAWCDGRARARFVGSVPRCDTPSRGELLCGDGTRSTANPLEDLKKSYRARPLTAEPAR